MKHSYYSITFGDVKNMYSKDAVGRFRYNSNKLSMQMMSGAFWKGATNAHTLDFLLFVTESLDNDSYNELFNKWFKERDLK